MYRGYRVVAITCFGRRRYTDLLAKYTRRCAFIDEHHLWINTEDAHDLESADRYCSELPGWFRKVLSQAPYGKLTGSERLSAFYSELKAEDQTIYLRLDDDILWFSDESIQALLDARIDLSDPFLVYANTINNSLCSHLHQRMGILPHAPFIEYACMGEVSWKRWETADVAHRTFFTLHSLGRLDFFHFPDWWLLEYERCSINCVAWFGRDNPLIRDHMSIGCDEERVLSCVLPRVLGRPNMIAGSALVSHFAYHTQRKALEANTAWLDSYARLAEEMDEQILSARA